METPTQASCRIQYFPISFFSMILGMLGISIASQKAEQMFHLPFTISPYLLGMSIFFFVLISLIYFIKIIRFKTDVIGEFNHPIKMSFFPTFSISLLLLSAALLSIDKEWSSYTWMLGASVHFLFTLKIVSIWIQHTKFDIKHMNPAWFIPAVGNILVPIAGVEHASAEISWFFYSIGFGFWLILLIIFFNRIIFHHPLPNKLLPTLFILIAPPALGFVSYVKLTGELNEFARMMYYFALFLFILLITQFKMLSKIEFYLSWWAYSFPIAALTIASILMYHNTQLMIFEIISLSLLAFLTIVLGVLLFKTGKAMYKREICVEED